MTKQMNTNMRTRFAYEQDLNNLKTWDKYKFMYELQGGPKVSWYEMYDNCLICNHTRGCMINDKGTMVVCVTQESPVVFSTKWQSWVHALDGSQPNLNLKAKTGLTQSTTANEFIADKVYKMILSHYPLTPEHTQHLIKERGMTLEEIKERGYASYKQEVPLFPVPDPNGEYVKDGQSVRFDNLWIDRLVKAGLFKNDWKGVAGFYMESEGDERMLRFHAEEGILIPFRNGKKQIVGLQVRLDDDKRGYSESKSTNPEYKAEIIPFGKNKLYAGVEAKIVNIETGEVIGQATDLKYPIIIKDGLGNIVSEFTFKQEPKYKWVSSANRLYGVKANVTAHVAYSLDNLKNKYPYVNTFWITEGGLKADIIASNLHKGLSKEKLAMYGSNVIAVAGTGQWRRAIEVAKNQGAKTVVLAFDSDYLSNEAVRKDYNRMATELKENTGINVFIAKWQEYQGKGLDDLLLNGYSPSIEYLQDL
ncbi:MAG: DUF3854 domain-containing protein [Streptococcaceae bacterium]|nr:DUF3854 domain-containing protein [Streptococcaceae bacterium]